MELGGLLQFDLTLWDIKLVLLADGERSWKKLLAPSPPQVSRCKGYKYGGSAILCCAQML